ncbi:uncharacterized protein LOC106661253 isoform X2 [Cimex lectularius]|uniref:Uncharacterized protein n=1 Tax=Cimex lectularius TaxID=79782 RepID=A0A8I6TB91_CIMLE|nr:uncharacterized protein LOC106661253 isoform X2 [Cimex lectularius]
MNSSIFFSLKPRKFFSLPKIPSGSVLCRKRLQLPSPHASKRLCTENKEVNKSEHIKLIYPAPVIFWKKVQEFLEKHFSDEPFYQMFKVQSSPDVCLDKREAISETLRNNVSVIAVECSSGKLVGVSLNGVLYEKDLEKPMYFHNKKLAKISEIIMDINKECDTFKRFCVMKTEATSTYTYKILRKLNHEVILEKKYSDFLTYEKTLMDIEHLPEHTHIRIMVKEFN